MGSLISNIVHNISIMKEEKYAIRKLNRYIRIFSSVILLITCTNNQFAWVIDYAEISCIMWNEGIRSFLNSYIGWTVVIVFLHRLVFWIIISCLIKHGDNFDLFQLAEEKILSIIFTMDDLIDFGCSLFFLGYVINKFCEVINGIENENQWIIYVAGIYLVLVFVNWIYEKNYRILYDIKKENTGYCDKNGREIWSGAYVFYKGIKYQVYRLEKFSYDINNNIKRSEWRIKVCHGNDHIPEDVSLAYAVQDQEGNLILDTAKWGE